jgi:hypothetical protein
MKLGRAFLRFGLASIPVTIVAVLVHSLVSQFVLTWRVVRLERDIVAARLEWMSIVDAGFSNLNVTRSSYAQALKDQSSNTDRLLSGMEMLADSDRGLIELFRDQSTNVTELNVKAFMQTLWSEAAQRSLQDHEQRLNAMEGRAQ